MKNGNIAKVSLVLIVAVVASSFAGTIEIKEMQFSFVDLPYYSSQTLGFSQGTALAGDVAIPTGPGTVDWAYTIQDAVVTLSNMPLIAGLNSNTGTFGSPATLTVTGHLVNKATATDLTGGATLLVAQMDQASLVMTEVLSQFAAGGAVFNTTGGLLFSGVADGGTTLVLEGFEMGLWGKNVPVWFGPDNTMTPKLAQLQITTDAIPEPATLGLLSLGMLLISRKRKQQ